MRCGAAKGAVGVETRQQCESDAGDLGGSRNSRRHLGRIGIGRAVVVVMEIVEFPDARKTLLEHLDIEQRRDRLRCLRGSSASAKRYIVSRQVQNVSAVVAAYFGEAGHAALERMTMQARYSRDGQLVAFIAGSRRRAGRDLRDDPIGHNHLHVISPPGRQQR